MKIASLPVVLLLLSPAARPQNPPANPADLSKDIQINIQSPIKRLAAVPLADEPHHAHVLQNDFVRVYNVTVAPLDATLLHQHDKPYLYLMLGATDVVNNVEGKPDVRLQLADGTTGYTPGGFAHIVRTDAGIPFHNITMELEKRQTSPRNLPPGSEERPLGSCPPPAVSPKPTNNQTPVEQSISCFETDQVHLDLVRVEGGKDYSDPAPRTAALLVAMTGANLEGSLGGQHAAFLHEGDVLWLPAGVSRRVGDFLGTKSSLLLLSFKDSAAPPLN
jgi:hypothetical protein